MPGPDREPNIDPVIGRGAVENSFEACYPLSNMVCGLEHLYSMTHEIGASIKMFSGRHSARLARSPRNKSYSATQIVWLSGGRHLIKMPTK